MLINSKKRNVFRATNTFKLLPAWVTWRISRNVQEMSSTLVVGPMIILKPNSRLFLESPPISGIKSIDLLRNRFNFVFFSAKITVLTTFLVIENFNFIIFYRFVGNMHVGLCSIFNISSR